MEARKLEQLLGLRVRRYLSTKASTSSGQEKGEKRERKEISKRVCRYIEPWRGVKLPSVNYPSYSQQLTSFAGKTLLLSVFFHSCSSCSASCYLFATIPRTRGISSPVAINALLWTLAAVLQAALKFLVAIETEASVRFKKLIGFLHGCKER